MSLRDNILAHAARPISEPIDVPEWGEAVYIRTMTVADRLAIGQAAKDDVVPFPILIARGLCDAEGKRIFADSDTGAIENLPGAHLDVLGTLGAKILEFNRMRPEDTEAAQKK